MTLNSIPAPTDESDGTINAQHTGGKIKTPETRAREVERARLHDMAISALAQDKRISDALAQAIKEGREGGFEYEQWAICISIWIQDILNRYTSTKAGPKFITKHLPDAMRDTLQQAIKLGQNRNQDIDLRNILVSLREQSWLQEEDIVKLEHMIDLLHRKLGAGPLAREKTVITEKDFDFSGIHAA